MCTGWQLDRHKLWTDGVSQSDPGFTRQLQFLTCFMLIRFHRKSEIKTAHELSIPLQRNLSVSLFISATAVDHVSWRICDIDRNSWVNAWAGLHFKIIPQYYFTLVGPHKMSLQEDNWKCLRCDGMKGSFGSYRHIVFSYLIQSYRQLLMLFVITVKH